MITIIETKTFEMPKSCELCPFHYDYYAMGGYITFCKLKKNCGLNSDCDLDQQGGKDPKCPLEDEKTYVNELKVLE